MSTDLVNDLTPQLGGDLDLDGKNLDFPSVPNIADCLDDDTMAANSAVALVTQQSVKAYANTVGAASLAKSTFEARMTLTTAVPVTPADVAAATAILLAPLGGAGITINDGSLWKDITLSQLSHTVTSLTASKLYDLFLDYNEGTPQLVSVVWTDDTNRATALALQDFKYVRASNIDHLYVGTFYVDSAQRVNDSFALRHNWKYYNRRRRVMRVNITTDSWNYTTATIRQAGSDTANQLDYIVGVEEDAIIAHVSSLSFNTNATERATMIGLDSTSALVARSFSGYV